MEYGKETSNRLSYLISNLFMISAKAEIRCTVKLLLNDQLRDHKKAVIEDKGLPNATKVHHTKQNDSIYYTFTTHSFQQNPMLLVLV